MSMAETILSSMNRWLENRSDWFNPIREWSIQVVSWTHFVQPKSRLKRTIRPGIGHRLRWKACPARAVNVHFSPVSTCQSALMWMWTQKVTGSKCELICERIDDFSTAVHVWSVMLSHCVLQWTGKQVVCGEKHICGLAFVVYSSGLQNNLW